MSSTRDCRRRERGSGNRCPVTPGARRIARERGVPELCRHQRPRVSTSDHSSPDRNEEPQRTQLAGVERNSKCAAVFRSSKRTNRQTALSGFRDRSTGRRGEWTWLPLPISQSDHSRPVLSRHTRGCRGVNLQRPCVCACSSDSERSRLDCDPEAFWTEDTAALSVRALRPRGVTRCVALAYARQLWHFLSCTREWRLRQRLRSRTTSAECTPPTQHQACAPIDGGAPITRPPRHRTPRAPGRRPNRPDGRPARRGGNDLGARFAHRLTSEPT